MTHRFFPCDVRKLSTISRTGPANQLHEHGQHAQIHRYQATQEAEQGQAAEEIEERAGSFRIRAGRGRIHNRRVTRGKNVLAPLKTQLQQASEGCEERCRGAEG